MTDDLCHTLLALSRKQLTLAFRTLVMRELVQQRAHLIRQYLRRQGSHEPWGAFLAQADRTPRRVLHELLTHDTAHRRLAQAKAELDGVLTRQAYAECTAPLLTRELHQLAVQLVTRRLGFAAHQLEHSPDEYSRELWAEQQDYYRELQASLHSQWYDAAVPQSGDRPPLPMRHCHPTANRLHSRQFCQVCEARLSPNFPRKEGVPWTPYSHPSRAPTTTRSVA